MSGFMSPFTLVWFAFSANLFSRHVPHIALNRPEFPGVSIEVVGIVATVRAHDVAVRVLTNVHRWIPVVCPPFRGYRDCMTTHHEWGSTITPTDLPHSNMEWAGDAGYRDYVGAIAIEKDITTFTPELHEKLGLDRDRWTIIGLNASPVSGKRLLNDTGRDDMIRVYAVDREKLSNDRNVPGGLHFDSGPVEVVEFYLHDMSLSEILECFKSVSISVTSRGIDHSRIKVSGLADIPVQPD